MDRFTTEAFSLSIQRLIYRLIKDFELCDQICLARYGVTASQGYTLLALPSDTSVSMNELSETMGLANSTMTRMIDNLARKGLVYRRHDEEDRRVVLVGLSGRGREIQSTMEEEKQLLMQEVLADIPIDEHPVILNSLEKITRAFGKAVELCKTGCSS